jgi:predicted LPLAT superfamily acyltransferase
LRLVTRRHATSTPGLLAALRRSEGPAALAAMVATPERAVRAHPTQWFNFFDMWSLPRVTA